MVRGGSTEDLGVELARSGMRGFSGARLRRYRDSLDLTMADLADAAGVSEQTVSAWETGRASPTPPLLKRVAEVLNVTVPDLAPIPSARQSLGDLRALAGFTQEGAARALGISATVLGRIEKGRKDYDKSRANEMANLYGVKPSLIKTVWERDRATRQDEVRRL
ncbi:helix-turn-helix transcriptional regulator (plasmid) [Rhodococcus aetherivorans]|uniref:helix-turn-helix transcriptional regulator n=2 Tax=Rhodococcus TaxID=1827 RepID=UPI0021A3B41F|nr:helix-turn-helix transcriptional regulator [Rhodococcus aetherivorans]